MWVLSVGGEVRVRDSRGGDSYIVNHLDELPKGNFTVETVTLDDRDGVTDEKVRKLWGLKAMSELGLARTKVTDAGVDTLPELQSLRLLNLQGCPITDKGLASLGRMPNLENLIVNGDSPSWETVENTSSSPSSKASIYAVTDTGIKSLSGLNKLVSLSLESDKVTNFGLASIDKDSPKLSTLLTVGFQVDNDGVIPLTRLKDLRVLELSKSLIDDKCIGTLGQLKWLEHLVVQGTKITPEGVKRLQAQLPTCKVYGGEYNPRRNIIRNILVLGGQVTISSEGQPPHVLASFDDLPEQFSVHRLDLHGVRPLWLNDLAIPEVAELILTDSGVSPAIVRQLWQIFPNVIELDLEGTAIGDQEATALTRCEKLTDINLTRTGVTDIGGNEIEKKFPNADVFWGNLPEPALSEAEVAKWAIEEMGGQVQIQEKGHSLRDINKVADLPAAAFHLRRLIINRDALGAIPGVNDVQLSPLRGQRYIESISMQGHSLSDVGVLIFETMPGLMELQLQYPHKSAKGLSNLSLASLGKIRHLRFLILSGNNQITTEGVRQLGVRVDMEKLAFDYNPNVTDEFVGVICASFPNLKGLDIMSTRVGDEGLMQLARLKSLTRLNAGVASDSDPTLAIPFAKVTDRGLLAISQVLTLESLSVSGIGITDNGVQSLQRLPKLNELSLGFTEITNESVPHLVGMKSLNSVVLRNTKLTPIAIKTLREARSDWNITESSWIEWLRGMFNSGAKITVRPKSKEPHSVSSFDELPKSPFTIQIVDYRNQKGDLVLPSPNQNDADAVEFLLENKKVTVQQLKGIAKCKSLKKLDLKNTNVVDEYLEFLYPAQTLESIDLTGTGCTPAGVASLKAALPKRCKVIGP